jgi:hypothetical protein
VVVDFRSGQDVLDLGIAVTLIILALTVFLRLGTKDHADETG